MNRTGSTTERLVRAALRGAGPLSIDEVLARVLAQQPLPTRNPRQTVGNALTSDPLCQRTGDGRYVYLPTFIAGACVRVPMDVAVPAKGLLAVGAEVGAFLWSMVLWGDPALAPALALNGGPVVTLDRTHTGLPGGMRTVMALPAAFWRWWADQQTDVDALLLCCADGEAARFTVCGLRTAALDAVAIAMRNAQLREAAAVALKRTRGLRVDDLARRLLAHGVYHSMPPPDPLRTLLFDPAGPLSVEQGLVVYRPELAPALRRLFAPRLLQGEQLWDELLVREALGLAPPPEPAPPPPVRLPSVRASKRGVRLKVSLQWDRRVWRALELLENHTLEDLHNTIQRAFGWDNDHLYAFFLSGRAWDSSTEVVGPFGPEAEPPTTDEVTLADLEPRPGQRFLYIFDFGDELRHEVEIQDTFAAPTTGDFPRIVASHGQAPPQYRSGIDEEDDETVEE